jgi:uncharacterized protein YfdQ (DUF2303 family)
MNPEVNNTQTAIDAGKALASASQQARRVTEWKHGIPFVVLTDADGKQRVEQVSAQLIHPTFRSGEVVLLDAPSFVAYVNRHKIAASSVYATLDPCYFEAVLDEHPPGGVNGDEAEWREFRAAFSPALSKEWLAWMGRNGQARAFDSTDDLAYFIEDNAPDFVEPTAAAMLEMALNFKVTQNASYKNAKRLQDGTVAFHYTSEVDGKIGDGDTKIPDAFAIKIPVFMGVDVPREPMNARFRYRLQNGNLRIWFDLERPHKVLEAAFKRVFDEIRAGLGDTPLLLGKSD